MSYSFSVRGATKAAALEVFAAEFAKVVAQQASHARDEGLANSQAKAFAELLTDDASKDVEIRVSGSLGGPWSDGDYTAITHAGCSVSAGLVDRPAA